MSVSIWDYEKPLDALMLSHDHMAAMVLKHEQQIKDLAMHVLELKQLVTPTVKNSLTVQWVGLTDDEMQTAYRKIDDWNACLAFINGKLQEKNGG